MLGFFFAFGRYYGPRVRFQDRTQRRRNSDHAVHSPPRPSRRERRTKEVFDFDLQLTEDRVKCHANRTVTSIRRTKRDARCDNRDKGEPRNEADSKDVLDGPTSNEIAEKVCDPEKSRPRVRRGMDEMSMMASCRKSENHGKVAEAKWSADQEPLVPRIRNDKGQLDDQGVPTPKPKNEQRKAAHQHWSSSRASVVDFIGKNWHHILGAYTLLVYLQVASELYRYRRRKSK